MNYITLLEMALKRQAFRLHPGLSPEHYQITDSLREYDRWRAITHCGTNYSREWLKSRGEHNKKSGELMEIGYVMISLIDDTIVPIARGDEHHMGQDVMYDEISKECNKNGHPINPHTYLPVWAGGSNYIYRKADIEPMLVVLKKFLSYGGIDGPLQGADELSNLMMNSSEFISRKGSIKLKQGSLAPGGQRVYKGFAELAAVLRTALNTEQRSIKGKAFQQAIKFAKQLRVLLSYLSIDDYEVLYKPEILDNLRRDGSDDALRQVEALFFGWSGIKNQIHIQIKECAHRVKTGEHNFYKDDKIKALWGDLDLAIDMLGRI